MVVMPAVIIQIFVTLMLILLMIQCARKGYALCMKERKLIELKKVQELKKEVELK
jgi:hypothetical protein